MKTMNNKKVEETTENNWPLNAIDKNQEEENLEKEKEEDQETGDWGDVDPASGPAPSAPGSAV